MDGVGVLCRWDGLVRGLLLFRDAEQEFLHLGVHDGGWEEFVAEPDECYGHVHRVG